MMKLRTADQRGAANFGWLDSRHTFSFGSYYDPENLGFGHLRVINEDRVKPGKGFGTHAHSDMEIISYVIDGALEHKDSMGNGSVIIPGDVQRMTAGTGITHSEFNPSTEDLVHFLQIWILPERSGLEPGYQQKAFSESEKADRLCLIGSRDGRDGSLTIHQNVDLYTSRLSGGACVAHCVQPGRRIWVQAVRGTVIVDGTTMNAGDGAAAEDVDAIHVEATEDSEILLFDMD